MNRAARKMALLERRPWTLALISAAGVTLLVPSVLALYGPPELLDSAIALGDTRLALGLTGLFAETDHRSGSRFANCRFL